MALFTGMNLTMGSGSCPSGSYDQGDGTCLWGDGSVTDTSGNLLSAGSGGAGAPPSLVSSMSTGGIPTAGVTTAIGTAVGEFLGGPVGALIGGAAGAVAPAAYNYLTAPGVGARVRATHLNRSTYVTRKNGLTLVVKGTKRVANRRRNAGNAKAVRRAVGRLKMFNHLAAKVHREIAKAVPHRARTASCAPARRARGHREGCRCFACRR